MSKRCKLQKEYYKKFGKYKGVGRYSDHYVNWLEGEVLALRLYGVVSSKITALITYDEEIVVFNRIVKNKKTKIIEVDDLKELNKLGDRLIDVKVLK